MLKHALILDLDLTIFDPRTIDARAFEPFFSFLTSKLRSQFHQDRIDSIQSGLWIKSWDVVQKEHSIPDNIFSEAIEFLDRMEVSLDISTYPDYHHLSKLGYPQYLVTTSVTSIQKKKIKALGIENDFSKLIINDPFRANRSKKDIFADLRDEFNLDPAKTFVIGDNSESEIKAGNELGMVTIQILRHGVVKGDSARHHIHTFAELKPIINSY